MNQQLILIIFIIITLAWGQQLTIDNRNQNQGFFNSQNGQNNQIPLTFKLILSNNSFNLPLKVAGINYNPQIDSGSSDFFIKGEHTLGIPAVKYSCPVCISRNPKYNISYMTGEAQTYEQSLPVTFGGRTFSTSVLVAFQAVEMNDDEGIIGLSYASFAQNPNPTFLQTLINNKIISSYSYGVNLNLKSSTSSYITLGSYDPHFFSGNLVYVPFSRSDSCYVRVNSVSIGSGGALAISQGLLDTGTSSIVFNIRQYNKIKSSFQSQFNECFYYSTNNDGYEDLYCKIGRFSQLPKIRIVMNGNSFDLEKQVYLDSCQRNPDEDIQDLNVNTGNWYCSTMIQLHNEEEFVMGDSFFNRYYTYFDLQNNKAGFARNYEKYSLNMVVNRDSFDWDVWNVFFDGQKR